MGSCVPWNARELVTGNIGRAVQFLQREYLEMAAAPTSRKCSSPTFYVSLYFELKQRLHLGFQFVPVLQYSMLRHGWRGLQSSKDPSELCPHSSAKLLLRWCSMHIHAECEHDWALTESIKTLFCKVVSTKLGLLKIEIEMEIDNAGGSPGFESSAYRWMRSVAVGGNTKINKEERHDNQADDFDAEVVVAIVMIPAFDIF